MTGSRDNTARLWDAGTGAEIAVWNAHTGMVGVASFSPNGKRVVTGSHDGTARLWDAESGAEIAALKAHSRAINTAGFSADGKRVVTGSDDNTARLWDAESGAEISILKAHSRAINTALISPDGKRVITGSDDGTARLWNASTGTEIAVLNAHSDGINAASFSFDGKRVVTGSDDRTARLWDAEGGSEIAVLKAHTSRVIAASFSPDGKCVVTGSSDGTSRLWDVAAAAEIAVLKEYSCGINAVSFSPDAKRVVTGCDDYTSRLWDAKSGAEIAVLKAHSDFIFAASFSPDGKRVVTGSRDGTGRLWDAESDAEIAVLKAHSRAINTAVFSPDGKRVVTGSDDYTARLWDAENGAVIAALKGHSHAINVAFFSPDGKRVMTGSDDGTARLWDAATGTEIAVLNAHSGSILAASFSPDGTRAVTGCSDNGTARLWDTERGAEIALLKAHTSSILAASFSPDGKRVLSGSYDNSAKILDVSRTEAIMRGRALVLTAALGGGIGNRTNPEGQDLLMKALPGDDLFAQALAQLDRTEDDPELQDMIAALHAPLHPNCYLSPTQFAEKFGLDRPKAAAANDVKDEDGTGADAHKRDGGEDDKREAAHARSAITSPHDPSWHTPAAPPPPRKWYQRARKPANHGQRAAITKAVADLPADAPIRTLTGSQAFEDRLAAYEATNAKAVNAQTAYKRWGGVALGLATVATLIAAATLLPVSALVPVEADRVVSGLQALANILALLIVWWLGRAGAIDRWLTTRADAERRRGQLFADLLAAPAPPGSDVTTLWSQKLALFNAAHVDYQRRYLSGARKRHTKAAAGLSWPRTLAFGATALSIVIGACAFFDFWPDDLLTLAPWLKLAEEPVRWQLGLGTLASGLLAYASARTLIHQDERNAALYRHTGERLDELVTTQGKVAEDAAARGDGVAVIDYAQAAQAILDADHTAWQFHRPPRDPVGSAPGVSV